MRARAPPRATGTQLALRPRSPRRLGAMETRSPPSRPGSSRALKETALLPTRADSLLGATPSPTPSSLPVLPGGRRCGGWTLGAGDAAETQIRGLRSIVPPNSGSHLFLPTHHPTHLTQTQSKRRRSNGFSPDTSTCSELNQLCICHKRRPKEG